MRKPYRSCFYVLGIGALVFPSAWGTDAAETQHLTVVGRVFMEPVDARRILIAVATRADGTAEHIFMYTASERLRVEPHLRNWRGRVDYEAGHGLRLTPDDNRSQTIVFAVTKNFARDLADSYPIRLEQTRGLSHYVANPPFRIEDLEALRHIAGDCDQFPQRCVEVAGQFLPFPG